MIDSTLLRRWALPFVVAAILLILHLVPADIFGIDLDTEVFDLAHAIIFTGVACVAAMRLEQTRMHIFGWRLPPTLAVAIGVGAFAFFAESSQALTSRDASYGDLMRDACGILSGTLLAVGARQRMWIRTLLWSTSAIVLIAATWYPGRIVMARTAASLRFPILARFESILERPMLRPFRASLEIIEAPANWPRGGHVARVDPLAVPGVRGISIRGTRQDISQYRDLVLDLAGTSTGGMEIVVRLDTYGAVALEQRLPTRQMISAAPSTLRIPLTDTAAGGPGASTNGMYLRRVVIYVEDGIQTPFLLDDVRLE